MGQIASIFLRSVSEGLLGIELDDKLLFEFEVDIVSCRKLSNLSYCVLSIKLKPLGSGHGSETLDESLDLCAFLAGFLYGDNVTCLNEDRGDVNLLTVKSEVSVKNKLTSFLSDAAIPILYTTLSRRLSRRMRRF